MSDKTLAFSKLSAEIRARLLELQKPAPERFVFLSKPSALNYVAIIAGLGWIVYMLVATADYLWEPWMRWLFIEISTIVIPIAIFAASNLVRAWTGKVRPGYVFTANECISYRGDRIAFRSLAELESFEFLEPIKTIEVWIGDKVEKIKADDVDEAMRLDESFVEMRGISGESFLTPFVGSATAYDPMKAKILVFGIVAVGLIVGAGLGFLAVRMNRNHDDDQSWKRTENSQTVADIAAYRERHPSGRHAAEADRKIADIVRNAKDGVIKNAKSGANQAAVESLAQLLDEAATEGDRKIYIKYTEDRQLDEEVVKKMKKDTGLDISSYDFTLPATAIQYRKDKILNDISVMFLPATRNASIEFALADEPPVGAAVIEVRNVMKSVPLYYYFNWFSSTGGLTTYYNPGAQFEFDFELRPKDAAKAYKSQYVSSFTQNLKSGVFDTRDSANYSFDKIFFSAVSEDFAKYLQREFGFIE